MTSKSSSWHQIVRQDVKNTSWRQSFRHDVKNTSMKSKSSSWCQTLMPSKSLSWCQKVRHDIKNTSWHQKVIMMSKIRYDVKKFVMTPKRASLHTKVRHDVKNTLWGQKRSSWCQKIRHDVKHTSVPQKYVIFWPMYETSLLIVFPCCRYISSVMRSAFADIWWPRYLWIVCNGQIWPERNGEKKIIFCILTQIIGNFWRGAGNVTCFNIKPVFRECLLSQCPRLYAHNLLP